MSRWRETIGNGFGTAKNKGKTQRKPVTDERNGSIGGYHVEHWDGRQDAHVEVKPVRTGSNVEGTG